MYACYHRPKQTTRNDSQVHSIDEKITIRVFLDHFTQIGGGGKVRRATSDVYLWKPNMDTRGSVCLSGDFLGGYRRYLDDLNALLNVAFCPNMIKSLEFNPLFDLYSFLYQLF